MAKKKIVTDEVIMDLVINHPDAWRLFGWAMAGKGKKVDYKAMGMKEWDYRKAIKKLKEVDAILLDSTNKGTSIRLSKSARSASSTRAGTRAKRSQTPEWMPLTEAKDWWHDYHKEQNDDATPNWGAGEISALKGILEKLYVMAKESVSSDELFQIFKRWALSRDKWPEFHKSKWTLTYLNSKFADIYAELKAKHGAKADPGKFRAASQATVKRRFNPETQ